MHEFDAFWAVFPRRVGKFTARSAFDRALKFASAEQIIEGARRYAIERHAEPMQFTKHPTTWLNAGCWEDDAGANSNGRQQSVLAAFDRLEQRLTGTDDNPPRAANILRLPPR